MVIGRAPIPSRHFDDVVAATTPTHGTGVRGTVDLAAARAGAPTAVACAAAAADATTDAAATTEQSTTVDVGVVPGVGASSGTDVTPSTSAASATPMDQMMTSMAKMFQAFQESLVNAHLGGPSSSRGAGGAARMPGRLIIEFIKLDPPTYTGAADATEIDQWIRTMDKLFRAMQCTEDQRMILAPHQLSGPAEMWWEQRLRFGDRPFTWGEFQVMLRNKFLSDTVREKLRDSFLHLRQGTMTVDSYEVEFIRLSQYALWSISTEKEKINQFLKGLKFSLQMATAFAPISTYAEAVATALQVEKVEMENEAYVAKSKKISESPHKAYGGKDQLKVRSHDMKKRITCFFCGKQDHYSKDCRSKPQAAVFSLPNSRVTICYNCNQPGHISYKCSLKGSQSRPQVERPCGQGNVCVVSMTDAAASPDVITAVRLSGVMPEADVKPNQIPRRKRRM